MEWTWSAGFPLEAVVWVLGLGAIVWNWYLAGRSRS